MLVLVFHDARLQVTIQSDRLLVFDGSIYAGKHKEESLMTPQWEKRLTREALILVACLAYGLVLPLSLIPLSLLAMHVRPAASPDEQYVYVDFLHTLFTLCVRPLSNRLGWVLFLAPYPVFLLGRLLLWARRARQTRSTTQKGAVRRKHHADPRI